LAVELSLGMNGTVYRWLYAHVDVLHGFRARTVCDLAVCGLSVLAGFGFKYLNRRTGASRTLFITILVGDCAPESIERGTYPDTRVLLLGEGWHEVQTSFR
jgi:hypothetical protein